MLKLDVFGKRRVLFDKKGEAAISQTMLFWILMVIVVTGLLFSFAHFVSQYQRDVVRIPTTNKADMISTRFFESETCFAYVDSYSGKVKPGYLDHSLLTEDVLHSCYPTGEEGYEQIQFEISIPAFDISIATDDYFNVIDYTFEKEYFVVLEDGGVKLTTVFLFVSDVI